MYNNDHNPPHFHAVYAEYEAEISIQTLDVLAGGLPRRALAIVLEWASLHRTELRDNWRIAQQGKTPQQIAPLE